MDYSSFDTASAYGNEKWVGRGIRFCGKKRSDLFITIKLSNTEQRSGEVKNAFQNSMARLGIKYLDLYLMHWPNPEIYLTSWKQMEDLYKEGQVRAIGVCKFHDHHLERLLKIADVIPAINQIELHPLLSQINLVYFYEKNGIQVWAYTPLARMHDNSCFAPLTEGYLID
jgi:methylglyoxal/glyoxal reductase